LKKSKKSKEPANGNKSGKPVEGHQKRKKKASCPRKATNLIKKKKLADASVPVRTVDANNREGKRGLRNCRRNEGEKKKRGKGRNWKGVGGQGRWLATRKKERDAFGRIRVGKNVKDGALRKGGGTKRRTRQWDKKGLSIGAPPKKEQCKPCLEAKEKARGAGVADGTGGVFRGLPSDGGRKGPSSQYEQSHRCTAS